MYETYRPQREKLCCSINFSIGQQINQRFFTKWSKYPKLKIKLIIQYCRFNPTKSKECLCLVQFFLRETTTSSSLNNCRYSTRWCYWKTRKILMKRLLEWQSIWLTLIFTTPFQLTLVSSVTRLLRYYPNHLYSTLHTIFWMDWHHNFDQISKKLPKFRVLSCSSNTMRQLRGLIHSQLRSMQGVRSLHNDTF